MKSYSFRLNKILDYRKYLRKRAQIDVFNARIECQKREKELLGLVEPVEVSINTDERFLYQVLSPLPVSNGTVNEVEEPLVIPFHQFPKSPRSTVQELLNHLAVVQIPEPSTLLLGIIALGVAGAWRKWKRAA